MQVVKVALICSALVQAFPSAAKDWSGAYFCKQDAVGGLHFNQRAQKWAPTTFSPTGQFVVKLQFKRENKDIHGNYTEYTITVTSAGSNLALPCFGKSGTDEVKVYGTQIHCDGIFNSYRFNFDNNRFLEAYLVGYLDGTDANSDTPYVAAGLCTKIS